MTGFFLIFVLTLGIGGILVSVFDDDETEDTSQDPDPDMPPVDPDDPVMPPDDPAPAGQRLLYDGAETLLGTPGNDFLLADDPMHDGPSARFIELGDGDDFAQVTGIARSFPEGGQDPQFIQGGEGDDVVRVLNGLRGTRVEGGAGDDWIQGQSVGSYDGQEGDDTLELVADRRGEDSSLRGLGGKGQDTLVLRMQDYTQAPNQSVGIAGGEGSDSITVILDRFETSLDGPLPEENSITDLGVVATTDFDPDTDTSFRIINSLDEGTRAAYNQPNRIIDDVTIESGITSRGTPYSDIVVQFQDANPGDPLRTYKLTIRVSGTDSLTTSDFEFISQPTA